MFFLEEGESAPNSTIGTCGTPPSASASASEDATDSQAAAAVIGNAEEPRWADEDDDDDDCDVIDGISCHDLLVQEASYVAAAVKKDAST